MPLGPHLLMDELDVFLQVDGHAALVGAVWAGVQCHHGIVEAGCVLLQGVARAELDPGTTRAGQTPRLPVPFHVGRR